MIARKTWREIRLMAAVYQVILVLMVIPAVLVWADLYADFQRRSGMAKALGSMGEFMRKAVDAMGSRDEDFAYTSYMALQLFFKGANIAGIAGAVLFGTALFARERESLTLEFLLSRPIGRAAILRQKVWPCALAVAGPLFVTSWLTMPLSHYCGYSLPWWPLTLCSLHAAVFVLDVFLLTVISSLLCRTQAMAAFCVGGLVIVELAFYFVPTIRLGSMFRLADFEWYGPLLAANRGPATMFDVVHQPGFTTWLLLAGVGLYAAAHRILRRLEL